MDEFLILMLILIVFKSKFKVKLKFRPNLSKYRMFANCFVVENVQNILDLRFQNCFSCTMVNDMSLNSSLTPIHHPL